MGTVLLTPNGDICENQDFFQTLLSSRGGVAGLSTYLTADDPCSSSNLHWRAQNNETFFVWMNQQI